MLFANVTVIANLNLLIILTLDLLLRLFGFLFRLVFDKKYIRFRWFYRKSRIITIIISLTSASINKLTTKIYVLTCWWWLWNFNILIECRLLAKHINNCLFFVLWQHRNDLLSCTIGGCIYENYLIVFMRAAWKTSSILKVIKKLEFVKKKRTKT